MSNIIDDETAARLYNEIDITTGDDYNTKAKALEAWADAKDSERNKQDWDHLTRVYTDFDNYISDEGYSDLEEESRYRIANRQFIANQLGETVEDQNFLYPAKRDIWTQQAFGKKGLSEKETFGLIQQGVQSRNEVVQSANEIPGDIALGLFDSIGQGTAVEVPKLVSIWKERNAEKLKKLPAGWESGLLQAASDYATETEGMLRNYSEPLKQVYDHLASVTGRDTERAGETNPKSMQEIEGLADTLATMPPEVRDRAYAAVVLGAKQAGQEPKEFLEQWGESWSRTLNMFRSGSMVMQEDSAYSELKLLKEAPKVWKDTDTGKLTVYPGFDQSNAKEITPEERTELTAEAQKKFDRLQVYRELYNIADNQFDPIKKINEGGFGGFMEAMAYGSPQALAYTGMALVPGVGPWMTGAAIYSEEYNKLRLDGVNPETARSIAAPSAILQSGLERVGAKMIFGKLPAFEKLMTKIGNPARVGRAGSAGIRFGTAVAGENIVEGTQDLVTPVVQDVAAALGADVPDVDWGSTLGQWGTSRLDVLAATIPGILIGTGVATMSDGKRFNDFNERLDLYRTFGMDEAAIKRVEDNQTPQDRQVALQSEYKKLTPDNIKAGISYMESKMDEAKSMQEDPNLPTITREQGENGKPVFVVRDEKGAVAYRSEEEQAAMSAITQLFKGQLLNERNVVVDLRNQWLSEDPTNVAIEAEAMTAQQKLEKLQAAGNVAQIEELHRRIATSPYKDTPYEQINILGEATVEDLGEMVFRGVITLNKNSKPEDAREEIHHVAVRKALMKGSVTLDTLRGWLDATETALPDKFPGLIRENENDIVESLARVQRAYEDGTINAEEEMALPASFVDYIKRMLKAFKEVLQRAVALRSAFKDGILPSEYETFLAESVGLNQQTMVDTTRERVGGELTQGTFNYSVGQRVLTDTNPFKGWFGEWDVDPTTASKVVDSDGKPMVVYHGTQRPDRVGDRFRKSRATSGPMAYFTSDPAVGSSYATGKMDTSVEMPSDYAGWFKWKGKGMRSPVAIDRAWWNLSPEERAAVNERIYTIGYSDWDAGEGPIVADSQSIMSRDSIDYELRQARGNGLRALVEMWLSSGSLFNQEERFLEVLQAAGVKGATLDDPNAARSAVYPVYLSIKNPLDTASIPGDVVSALEQAGKRKRAKQSAGKNPDGWDKNTISGNDWMAALKEDIAKGTTYAWTRIPDWVTETLSSFGYDGIKDTGGKRGGMQHQVWIPFNETQVKSATGNRGTFDPASANINYSIGKNYSNEEKYNQIVPEISSVNPNKVSRRDMYEVAKVSPDVAANMSFEKPIEVSLFADGTLMLSDGHHRLAAAKQLGMNSIPAVVRSINAKGNHINALIAEQQPGATNYSIGKAADLASKNPELAKEIQKKSDALLNAAEQRNDVFFTKFWPQMLKKTGMNFKPTKTNLLKAAETGMPEILEWLKSNPQYLDYYHKDWELTHDILKAVFPKMTDDDLTGFRLFTGITSPNTKLMHNMADAVQLFNLWMDKGSIKSMRWEWSAKGNRKVGGGPFTFSGTTGAGKTFTAHVLEDLHGKLGSWESVKNYLWEGVSIKELNAFNKEAGYKGTVDAGKIRQVVQSATGQSELIPRMFIFGPKVGAYTLNTSGDDRYTTTDIWEGRFIRSHFPAMFNDADGLPTSVEENKIFQEFAQAFNEVFKRESGLDLPPSALQAVRWFYMLNHAKKAGYKYASTDDTISGYTERAVRLKLGINPRPARAGGTGSDQANNGAPVQKGDTNYSIASQSEIDRVNKALGGMNRGPDERLKVYQRAKQKFSKLMAWNSDELAAMADTGSDDSQIRRTQILQGLGELDGIMSVLPPEVRGRVGGYTKLAGIAPHDVFKDGVKVSEVSGMNGAIISAWMREGQNIGQAGKQVSLPPGYTATENLSTKRADKAIADFFRDRIKRIDTELEKVLVREYTEAITKAVKQSRPKAGDNGVRKSTLGAETQKFADMVQRATLLDDEATPKRMAEIEAALANPDATAEDISALSEEWSILNTFGDLDNRSSETLAQGLDWLKGQLQMGREAWRIKEQARIDEQRARAAATIEWLGKGTAKKRNETKTTSQLASDLANHYLLSHASFEQFVTAIFPPEIAATWSDRLRKADEASQASEIRDRRGILDAVREGAKAANMSAGDAMLWLKGDQKNAVAYLEDRKVKDERIAIDLAQKIVTGEADRSKLTDADIETLRNELAALPADTQKEYVTIKRVIFRGKDVKLDMSRGKAIQYLLSWNQPDVQIKMRKEGWTDESAADLKALVNDPVSRSVVSYLQSLYGKGAGIVNPVYSRMFGMTMPQVKNYAPTRFLNAKDTKDIGLDGSPTATGTTPGFAKSRVTHSAKIAPEDALTVAQGHIAQQAHWVHFAELAREFRAILSNPEVRESIKQTHGESVLKDAELWADQLEQRGGNKARESVFINTILGTVLSGKAVSSLGFNLKTLAMQLDNSIRFGLALDTKQIVSALSNPSTIVEDIQTVWESDAIQNRLQGGATAEARFLFSRYAGKPNFAAKIAEASMTPINWLDSAATSISSAIVYRANLNDAIAAGMPENLAKQTALDAASQAIFRFAQPVSFGQKSIVENNGNVMAKMFFLFMSDARLKTAILADAARGLATGRGNASEHRRRIFTVELMAVLSHVVSSAFRDAFSDDDDEEIWNPGGFAKAILLAPLQGFFFAGTVGELAISKLTGQKTFNSSTQNPLLSSMEQAVRAGNNLEDAFDLDDPDAMLKEWNNIFRSMALSPAMAAPAVLLNMVKPVVGLYQNATTEE